MLQRSFITLLLLLGLQSVVFSQTFRGGIAGTVVDASGAAVPDTAVKIENKETGLARSLTTDASGAFSFPDLPVAIYTLTTEKAGFQPITQQIEVAVGKITSASLTIGVAGTVQTVEVQSAAATIETHEATLNAVVATKAVQEIPLNGRDYTQLLRLTPGYNDTGSMNGARGRSNNWQIDGADNNDFWQNGTAVNQGSISGVAGVLLPIDAIDQFNQQASGDADSGRNPGSSVNVVIKSGTNSIHGTAYYFIRNEAMAAHNPFAPPNSSNPELRNQNYGFSLGGPIWKNKTFFFITYEHQKFIAGNTVQALVPSQAFITRATTLMAQNGIAVNPVMLRTFNLLWPSSIAGAPYSTSSNYFSGDPSVYKSDNGIIKLDHSFNEKYTLSARAFLGTGEATAYAGSVYGRYFQTVPSRQPNYDAQFNAVLTPRLVNQLLVGVNYFMQAFNDADHGQNLPAVGFNTGVTNPSSYGSPSITITNFPAGGFVGATPQLGRTDTTGHITDNLSYTTGSHSFKMGGEFRKSRLDIYYQRNVRGSFTFDGTQGPWASSSADPAVKSLADFLAGYLGPNQGSIAAGDPQRVYDVNSYAGWFADSWQATPNLTINLGLRYEFNSPLHEVTTKGLATFLPSSPTGFGIPGQNIGSIYPADPNNLAPRVGFAYTPVRGGKTVIRGGYGFFYDMINGNFFIDNAAGGERGISRNPVGVNPFFGAVAGPTTIQDGVFIFGSSKLTPPYSAFGINQDIRSPYMQNFNINVQRELTKSLLLQAGYVGSLGRKLADSRNINQPVASVSAANAQQRRPYNTIFPNLAGISFLETAANSHYNSFQTSLRKSLASGLTGQVSYTLAHAEDDMSDARGAQPMNNFDLRADYGNSGLDIRHTLSSYVLYDVPNFVKSMPRLGRGWQLNAIFIAHSGTPFSVTTGTDISHTSVGSDRVNVIGDPFSGIVQITNASGNWANGYKYLNGAAFTLPANGTYGTEKRNQFYGPGFNSVDFSVFKNTYITERINAQFRVEIFNLFNRLNLAGPNTSNPAAGSFGVISGTVNSGNSPGIGAGEPRNVQLALKFIW